MLTTKREALQSIDALLEKVNRQGPNLLTKARMVEVIARHRDLSDAEKNGLQRQRYNDLLPIFEALEEVEVPRGELDWYRPYRRRW